METAIRMVIKILQSEGCDNAPHAVQEAERAVTRCSAVLASEPIPSFEEPEHPQGDKALQFIFNDLDPSDAVHFKKLLAAYQPLPGP